MSDRIDLLLRINQFEKLNNLLQNEVDKYKHEYYSECDKNEMLERALDKACCELSFMISDIERNTWTQEKWKEWCMKDE